jgi:hypothetical protein
VPTLKLSMPLACLLAVACRTGGIENAAVLKTGESLIFENTKLCEAVIKADADSCESSDCRALMSDNALLCQTGDCAAIIQHDAAKCTNDDCKTLVDNSLADGKRSFAGNATACASSSCRALIKGQAGLCARR